MCHRIVFNIIIYERKSNKISERKNLGMNPVLIKILLIEKYEKNMNFLFFFIKFFYFKLQNDFNFFEYKTETRINIKNLKL